MDTNQQRGGYDSQNTQQGAQDTQTTQTTGEHDSSKHHHGHHIPNPLHHKKKEDDTDSGLTGGSSHGDLQNSSQGRDPAVVDDKGTKKLTGTGVPGSHSAVFGLTPDGKKHDETTSDSGPVVPASELGKPHKKEKQEDKANPSNDTSSRAPDSAGVAEQMHKVDNEPKGLQRKEPMDLSTDSTKPGAGSTGISQGTGDIRPGEGGDKTPGDKATPA